MKRARPVLRLVLVLVAVAFVGLAVWGMPILWRESGGGEINVHGYIALGIALVGIAGLTWALMRLAFHSAQKGYDDRA